MILKKKDMVWKVKLKDFDPGFDWGWEREETKKKTVFFSVLFVGSVAPFLRSATSVA